MARRPKGGGGGVPLGTVSVQVRAPIDQLVADFNKGLQAAQRFDKQLQSVFDKQRMTTRGGGGTIAAGISTGGHLKVAKEVEQLIRAEQRLGVAFNQTAAAATRYNQSISRAGQDAARASRQIESAHAAIRRSLLEAGAVLGAAFGTREIVAMTDQFTNLQNRIRVVIKDEKDLGAVTNDLFDIANRTRTAFEASATIFSRLAANQKGLGASQRELMQFTESLNQAIIVSGASAQEANAALIQLSQGMAAGELRGEELRSVLEQLPFVADIIAKHFNVTRGQLVAMGREGKLTAKDILTAFREAREEIAGKFAKTIPTLGQAFTVLNNELTRYLGEANKAHGTTQLIAEAIIGLSKNLDTVMQTLVMIAGIFGARYVAALANATRGTVALTAAEVGATRAATAQAAAQAQLAATTGLVSTSTARAIVPTAAFSGALTTTTLTATAATGALGRMGTALATAGALAGRAGAMMMSVFGGPIGIAIFAVAAAVYQYQRRLAELKAEAEGMANAQKKANDILDASGASARTNAKAISDLGKAHKTAAGDVQGFADAMDKATAAMVRNADQATKTRPPQSFLGRTGDEASDLFRRAADTRKEQTKEVADQIRELGRQIDVAQNAITRIRVEAKARPGIGGVTTAEQAEIRRLEGEIDNMKRLITQLNAEGMRRATRPLEDVAKEMLGPNFATQGRNLQAEITDIRKRMAAAQEAGLDQLTKDLLAEIKVRQRTLALQKDGLSFVDAWAQAQAEQLKVTREGTQKVKFTTDMALKAIAELGLTATRPGQQRPTWMKDEVAGGPSSQERLYNRFLAGQGPLAAKPGTSAHELRAGNVLDIPKRAGVTENMLKRQLEQAGARITKIIDEGGHWHVEWAKFARDGTQVADDMVRDEERFASTFSQLGEDIVKARMERIKDEDSLATAERALIEKRHTDFARETQAEADLQKIGQTEADILIEKSKQLMIEELRTHDAKEQERKALLANELSADLIETENDMLSIQESMSTTASEQRELQLRMLKNEYELEKLRLDRIIIEKGANSDAGKLAAQQRAALDRKFAAQQAATMQRTQGPLESYLAGIPDDVREIGEAIERYMVDQLEAAVQRSQELARSIGEAFGRASNLVDLFTDPLGTLQRLLEDITAAFQQAFITGPVTDFMTRKVGMPIAEGLTGAPAGPYGLNAAQVEASTLSFTKFTPMVEAATMALRRMSTQSIAPLGAEADATSQALGAATTSAQQFGNTLPGILQSIAGAVGGGAGGALGAVLGVAGAVMGSVSFGGSAGAAKGVASGKSYKYAFGMRDGGWIRGLGGEREDKNVIRVSPGEHITNARSARKHHQILDMINADRLPGFASGGWMNRRISSALSRLPTFSGPLAQFGDVVVYAAGTERERRETQRQVQRRVAAGVSDAIRTGYKG